MGLGSSTVCDIRLNTSLTPEERGRFQDGIVIRRILAEARTIAIVGMSGESTKASNMVGAYMQDEGYRVIPVNPRGGVILGETVYPDLLAIPILVDIVVAFRPAGEVPAMTEGALAIEAKALWMQLRIIDLASAARAQEAGLAVVVDRCIKMEHGRYSGALHWAGMNTEVITARRQLKRPG